MKKIILKFGKKRNIEMHNIYPRAFMQEKQDTIYESPIESFNFFLGLERTVQCAYLTRFTDSTCTCGTICWSCYVKGRNVLCERQERAINVKKRNRKISRDIYYAKYYGGEGRTLRKKRKKEEIASKQGECGGGRSKCTKYTTINKSREDTSILSNHKYCFNFTLFASGQRTISIFQPFLSR